MSQFEAKNSRNHSENILHRITQALASRDRKALHAFFQDLSAADIAYLIEALKPEERQSLVSLITLEPEILAKLNKESQEDIVEHLSPKQIVSALQTLESDDAFSILQVLEPELRQEVLRAISSDIRSLLEQRLHYPEDSAGRLMQQERLVLPAYTTVGEVKALLTDKATVLPKTFYEIFIYDPLYRPIGSVPLQNLFRLQDDMYLKDAMTTTNTQPIPISLDQEVVGQIFNEYGLISAPVINEEGRIVGIITADDVFKIISLEAEEDLTYLQGGGTSESSLRASFQRLRWLVVTFLNTFLASGVIYLFEPVIKEIIELAVLMPIVAAMGGNAGMQVVTTVVRSLAMNSFEIRKRSFSWIVARELRVGLINGIIFAAGAGFFVALWFHNIKLSLLLSLGLVFNIVWAGFAGSLIPIGFAKFKMDPAVASGPLLTTTTDVLGYAIFLGLATLYLR